MIYKIIKTIFFLRIFCEFFAKTAKKNNDKLRTKFSLFLLRLNFNIQIFTFMEKTKLIEMRKAKRISQQQMADFLCMDVSNYNRRENGEVYIRREQWEKLAKILDVPLSEIYEDDEKQLNRCGDNATGNFIGTNFGPNNIYSFSEILLEMQQKHLEIQQKYIAKLEEEIKELKKKLK